MAFPQVESQVGLASGDQAGLEASSATASHTLTLPGTISPQAVLLAMVASDDDPNGDQSATWATGWTRLVDVTASGGWMGVGYKVADGSEDGTTITLTLKRAEEIAYKIFSITGAGAVTASSATGVDANPNPPSHTPPTGTMDYLWFAATAIDAYRDFTTHLGSASFPADYATGQGEHRSSLNFGSASTLAWARRELRASSENPGTFTADSADNWVAVTIAVAPIDRPRALTAKPRSRLPHLAM